MILHFKEALEAIQNNTQSEIEFCDEDQIGDVGAQVIAEALKKNTILREIRFQYNN